MNDFESLLLFHPRILKHAPITVFSMRNRTEVVRNSHHIKWLPSGFSREADIDSPSVCACLMYTVTEVNSFAVPLSVYDFLSRIHENVTVIVLISCIIFLFCVGSSRWLWRARPPILHLFIVMSVTCC